MWFGDAIRRNLFVLLLLLTFAFSNVEARPRVRQLIAGSVMVCAVSIAANSFLQSDPGIDAQTTGSHKVTQAAEVSILNQELLAADEDEARFQLRYPNGEVPAITIFNKNYVQKIYASRVITAVREKIDDPDLREKLPPADYIRVEFHELEIRRNDNGEAMLVLHAGPMPMELHQTVPLRDLESGNFIELRFADFVAEHDSARLTASVMLQFRYLGDTGNFEVLWIEGGVQLAALLGTEKDSARSSACQAKRLGE